MSDAPASTTAPDVTSRTGDVLEAGVQIGDFKIERRIGAGGMGIVYQARQISLNRTVALKVLGQSLKRPSDLTRFQREAQAAARLSHPGVASIYFIGQDRHICYLVMELVEGVSLRRVLDRLGQSTVAHSGLDTAAREELAHQDLARPLRFDQPTEDLTSDSEPAGSGKDPLNPYLTPQAVELRSASGHIRRACELVRDVAGALAHAHERGVVHRDIKPDNILLDKSGKVHVIDFGVARFFDDLSVTYTGQLVGTPLYMSPEQVTGRGAIDPRTDVYSLGLVLYELLTLRPPLEAANRENLLRTIVTAAAAGVVAEQGGPRAAGADRTSGNAKRPGPAVRQCRGHGQGPELLSGGTVGRRSAVSLPAG
jgi:serine/threonine protein kinase